MLLLITHPCCDISDGLGKQLWSWGMVESLHLIINMYIVNYAPRSWKGGILVSHRPSIRTAVCGQNRVRSVSSTVPARSISYLRMLSSNFRKCTCCVYKSYCKIQRFEFLAIFFICNFDFVLLWHGIWYESIVSIPNHNTYCVIWYCSMGNHGVGGWVGVFSEHRRSSCSSYLCWGGWGCEVSCGGHHRQEERPPRGQLWMEQCLTSLKYWPI